MLNLNIFLDIYVIHDKHRADKLLGNLQLINIVVNAACCGYDIKQLYCQSRSATHTGQKRPKPVISCLKEDKKKKQLQSVIQVQETFQVGDICQFIIQVILRQLIIIMKMCFQEQQQPWRENKKGLPQCHELYLVKCWMLEIALRLRQLKTIWEFIVQMTSLSLQQNIKDVTANWTFQYNLPSCHDNAAIHQTIVRSRVTFDVSPVTLPKMCDQFLLCNLHPCICLRIIFSQYIN